MPEVPVLQKVRVIGGGVSGLTTAILLAEHPSGRFDVEIVAEKIGGESLSRVAGALFFPYSVHHPNLEAWISRSLDAYRDLESVEAAGVRTVPGMELFEKKATAQSWMEQLPGFQSHLSNGGRRHAERYVDGCSYRVPVIEVPVYLQYLLERFDVGGKRVQRARLDSLDDVLDEKVIVVNASGVQARTLVPDPSVEPSLGQVVRIARGDIDHFVVDEMSTGQASYVVPRSDDCILGTIDRPWSVEEQGYEPPPPDTAELHDIVARCSDLDCRVAGAEILDSYCGIRPNRAQVCVEVDAPRWEMGQRVVHNYGHGGSGVTLSWGSATDAVSLVSELSL